MSYNFVIAPDFSPERFIGWHMLNTLLQKRSELAVHIETPSSHEEELQLVDNKDISIIYANPFDAAKFIREKGYKAFARPINKSNEMVIVSASKGDVGTLGDLTKGCTVSMPDNRDVKLVGLRLLEAEDIYEADINFVTTENYQAAIKQLIQGSSDAAFLMEEMYDSLSGLTKSQLNLLIKSDLALINHIVLVKDGFAEADAVKDFFLSLNDDAEGQKVLDELGISHGFESMDEEDAEFMIDLMEILLD